MADEWTVERVRDLVAGKFVSLYDATGAMQPVPPWILDASLGEVSQEKVGDRLASTHTDDRWKTVEVLRRATAAPGELVTTSYRTNVRGQWMLTELTVVNLLGHPEVDAILACAHPGRPTEGSSDEPLANEGGHDAAPWLLGRLDASGVILEIEGKVPELTGRSPEEIVGMTPLQVMHPDSSGDSVAMWWQLLGTEHGTSTSRRCFLHPDGTEVWAECTYLNRLGDSTKGDVLWMAHDITARRAQEQALADSHEEVRRLAQTSHALAEDFRLLADEVPAAVFRCDPTGTITFHNARWDELVPGTDLTRLSDAVHPSAHGRLDEALTALVHGEGDGRTTIEVPSVTGGRIFSVTCRSDGHEDPGRRQLVGSIADVTTTVRLRQEASHDKLTGLVNRQGLEQRLDEALRHDPEGTLLVFFDLDGFKAVNDAHGHEAGDVVLRELGTRLADAIRPIDTISRYGGDEFVLVCTAVAPDGVGAILDRLHLVLAATILFEGGTWQPSASIGTARARPGDDAAAVIRRADLAMFESKRLRYEEIPTPRRP